MTSDEQSSCPILLVGQSMDLMLPLAPGMLAELHARDASGGCEVWLRSEYILSADCTMEILALHRWHAVLISLGRSALNLRFVTGSLGLAQDLSKTAEAQEQAYSTRTSVIGFSSQRPQPRSYRHEQLGFSLDFGSSKIPVGSVSCLGRLNYVRQGQQCWGLACCRFDAAARET